MILSISRKGRHRNQCLRRCALSGKIRTWKTSFGEAHCLELFARRRTAGSTHHEESEAMLSLRINSNVGTMSQGMPGLSGGSHLLIRGYFVTSDGSIV